jgi:hypothetical protein
VKNNMNVVLTLGTLLPIVVLAQSIDASVYKLPKASDGYCLGIRGNGPYISGHFAVEDSLLEELGYASGAAGGSSGSISVFMIESVTINPIARLCGLTTANWDAAFRECVVGKPAAHGGPLHTMLKTCGTLPKYACADEREAARRSAFLLKAFPAYLQKVGDDVSLIKESFGDVQGLLAARSDLLKTEWLKYASLSSFNASIVAQRKADAARVFGVFSDIISPEWIEKATSSKWHADDLLAAMKRAVSFNTEGDPGIMIRDGVVSFAGLARSLDRYANYLAAYLPEDKPGSNFADFALSMLDLVDVLADPCSKSAVGKSWFEWAPANAACATKVVNSLSSYREALIKLGDGAGMARRSQDMIGAFGFKSVVATSVLDGASAQNWLAKRKEYERATSMVSFDVKYAFKDVKFGYFSAPTDVAAIDRLKTEGKNAKAKASVGLGQYSWQDVLNCSPQEPGLGRGVPLSELKSGTPKIASGISAGGWPDMHPHDILKQGIGCARTVYMTREGPEGDFPPGMLAVFGGSKADLNNHFSYDRSGAAARSNIESFDVVVCAAYQTISDPLGAGLPAIMADGKDAIKTRTEIRTPWLAGKQAPASFVKTSLKKCGCSKFDPASPCDPKMKWARFASLREGDEDGGDGESTITVTATATASTLGAAVVLLGATLLF